MNLFTSMGTLQSPLFNLAKAGNMVLWLDANDPAGTGVQPTDGSALSTWVDKSGNGNNFSGGSSPTFVKNIVNAKPIIRFNGSSNYLVKSSPTGFNIGTGDFSAYLVVVDRRSSAAYTHYLAMPDQSTFALKRYDSTGQVYLCNGSNSLTGINTSVGVPWIACYTRSAGTRYWRWNNYTYSQNNLLLYPRGNNDVANSGVWTYVGTGSPGSYGGDFAFGYSPSADQYFSQVVSGFKVGVSYTFGITVSNYSNGTLRAQIDGGSLLNTSISGNGTYSLTFTATAMTHTWRVWGGAGTVTMAQVNFKGASVKATNATDILYTGDTQSLNPASLNIGNGWASEFSNSDIAEIIFFNGSINDKNHSNIYNYLSSKWYGV